MAKKNTTKYQSNKQEKEVAKDLEGRVQIASGALWFCPADVRTDRFLIECKTTNNNYYSVTLKTWEKIRIEATKDGIRSPLLCVDIKGERFAICSFKEFNDYYKEIPPVLPYIILGSTRAKSIRLTSRHKTGEMFFDNSTRLLYMPWDSFTQILAKLETEEQ